MRKTKREKNTYSLVSNIKLFIPLLIFVISINLVISIFSLINIQHQNHEYIENSVSLFQDETSSHINAIQHFMEWTIIQELLVNSLETETNDYEQYLTLDALQIRIANHQYTTGNEFNYFLYLQPQGKFYNVSNMTFPYDDYTQIKKIVLQYANADSREPFAWKYATINNSVYMHYMITYKDRTLAAFVNVTELFQPLLDMNFVKQGNIIITDCDKNIVYSSKGIDHIPDSLFGHTLHTYISDKKSTPYNIYLYTNNLRNYGNLFVFQLFVIITSTIACLILAISVLKLYTKVMQPIQEFTENLSHLNEDSAPLDFQSSRVKELEQTNIQFKNLIRQIRNLKITIYENELEKKHSQITFLQHQIKPHFYLNCLTTINSLAQLEDYKKIEMMVNFTSRYLRYLFQTDKELLCIEYELAHIQAYLDIQQLRLGDFFSYTCSIEEVDKNALIPPLLLITFIENTIKHAYAGNQILQISLTVKQKYIEENQYLQIDITDSGQGFSEEILEKIMHKENPGTDERVHVGILNSMQRLQLLYGNNHKIRFFNGESGGAHIQLLIPYQI